jgi:hypothetical protein
MARARFSARFAPRFGLRLSAVAAEQDIARDRAVDAKILPQTFYVCPIFFVTVCKTAFANKWKAVDEALDGLA